MTKNICYLYGHSLYLLGTSLTIKFKDENNLLVAKGQSASIHDKNYLKAIGKVKHPINDKYFKVVTKYE